MPKPESSVPVPRTAVALRWREPAGPERRDPWGSGRAVVLTDAEREATAALLPAPGLAAAAGDLLDALQRQFGLDLWLLTRVRDDEQRVVVARGRAGVSVPLGAVQSWAGSYCSRMLAGEAPRCAPRTRDVPAYAGRETPYLRQVGAYLGVPVLEEDGTLFGTVCALSSREQPESLEQALPVVEAAVRLLATVLAKEAAAAERSAAAAEAYALAERDVLTGLLNRRGWQSRIAVEEARCRREGVPTSVVVLDLDGLKQVNDELGHAAGDERLALVAEVLAATSRPTDAVARTGGDEFGVLAVGCGRGSLGELVARLEGALGDAGTSASVGAACRRPTETLLDTWHRADERMYAARRANRTARGPAA